MNASLLRRTQHFRQSRTLKAQGASRDTHAASRSVVAYIGPREAAARSANTTWSYTKGRSREYRLRAGSQCEVRSAMKSEANSSLVLGKTDFICKRNKRDKR